MRKPTILPRCRGMSRASGAVAPAFGDELHDPSKIPLACAGFLTFCRA